MKNFVFVLFLLCSGCGSDEDPKTGSMYLFIQRNEPILGYEENSDGRAKIVTMTNQRDKNRIVALGRVENGDCIINLIKIRSKFYTDRKKGSITISDIQDMRNLSLSQISEVYDRYISKNIKRDSICSNI